MSRLSKVVKEQREATVLQKDKVVKNFMGGDSYVYSPLATLKMISASSIFGEPSYYRDGGIGKRSTRYSARGNEIWSKLLDYIIIPKEYNGKSTTEIMTDAIDAALDYDYEGTLNWAVELRTVYNIRLNPQIIMVRAAIHPKRKEFTANNKINFRFINCQVMQRADEPMVQIAYYLFINKGKKNNIPNIIKRSWSDKLSSLKPYAINKYKNAEIGMINAVRICHANSENINELMSTGDIQVSNSETTWEQMRSAGKDWMYILENCNISHMALIRNLRNIFSEIDNIAIADAVIAELKRGVLHGKQFPFRYYSAYKAIRDSDVHYKDILLDALEDCVDIAIENMPQLSGKTICLTDNSGSAWGTIPTEYGSVTVAEIDNLSSILTAKRSDEGYVGVFGDRLKIIPISKNDKVLRKLSEINKIGKEIGMNTEGGIWTFFQKITKNKDKFDNIFIYSDMQAGHGQLYGTSSQQTEYRNAECSCGMYINIFQCLLNYRRQVNKDVNMFSVQTAGYNNSVLPEYAYRTSMMSGWTGKEALFAKMLIDIWDNN
nr:MAG TPA: ribonucleoprotein [Caudoviricetes sp.]